MKPLIFVGPGTRDESSQRLVYGPIRSGKHEKSNPGPDLAPLGLADTMRSEELKLQGAQQTLASHNTSWQKRGCFGVDTRSPSGHGGACHLHLLVLSMLYCVFLFVSLIV